MVNLADHFGADSKILIVDDLMSARKIIEKLLRPEGLLHFAHAMNGKAALELINQGDIGLVISDWDMPEMDGISLLEEMRNSESSRDIPFIMVTSSSDRESVASAVKKGISSYIIKPFSRQILSKKIADVMSGLR